MRRPRSKHDAKPRLPDVGESRRASRPDIQRTVMIALRDTRRIVTRPLPAVDERALRARCARRDDD